MRGSHEGSFEFAHAMRDGQAWQGADAGDGHYDLVVVGGVESMSRVPMGSDGGAWCCQKLLAWCGAFTTGGSAIVTQ